MAILQNRYKAKSQILLRSILAVPEFLRRFSAAILFILSLQILYFSNTSSKISSVALEYSSYPIDFVLRIYDSATTSVGSIATFVRDFKDLRRENIELKLQLKKLQEVASYMQYLDSENKSLQKALKVSSGIKLLHIPARVLSLSTGPYGMSAIINSGIDSGVEEGQIVISDSAIVGKITGVSKSHSRMSLITDFSSRIPVFGSESGVRAILSGSNDNHPNLLYVLDDSKVKKGEVLISSGDGQSFPPGYKVARVLSVSNNLITTTPEVSLSTLRYVNILKTQE